MKTTLSNKLHTKSNKYYDSSVPTVHLSNTERNLRNVHIIILILPLISLIRYFETTYC